MNWGDILRPLFEGLAEGFKHLSAAFAGWFARDAQAKQAENKQLELNLEDANDASRRMADPVARRSMRDKLMARAKVKNADE